MARKTWKQMTKMERRVAIAKDVLKVLNLKNVIAEQGTYFEERNGRKKDFGCSIKPSHTCTVCAKGALLLGFMENRKLNPTNKADNVIVDKDLDGNFERCIGNDYISDKLAPTFGEEMLDDIETCFELWDWKLRYKLDNPDDVMDMYSAHSPRDRVRGIMGNIIKHDGNFVVAAGPIFYKPKTRRKPKKNGAKKTSAKKSRAR